MPDICDHTSVGMLVWRSGKLLMIERRKFPFGVAPPAGHVDTHGSFERAASEELTEEVGLTSTQLTQVLAGARSNPCRRQGGSWHYWRIYEAKAIGTLKPSRSETKSARWYSLNEIAQLLERTQSFQNGQISKSEWEDRPGIEPVWADIFRELGLIPNRTTTSPSISSADVKWARDHNWKWFEYHAEQRTTIFRFYLVFVALLFAGYETLSIEGKFGTSVCTATVLAITTFLFMRLDNRSRDLVKIGELFLKEEEAVVADRLNRTSLRLANNADEIKGNKGNRYFYTFRQIYSAIFGLILFISLLMICRSSWELYTGAPPVREISASIAIKEIPTVQAVYAVPQNTSKNAQRQIVPPAPLPNKK